MTSEEREESIKILSMWLSNGKQGLSKDGTRLGYIEGWFHQSDVKAFEMAIKVLSEEPLRPKGEWIYDMDSPEWSFKFPYKCSNCGADMRGEHNV